LRGVPASLRVDAEAKRVNGAAILQLGSLAEGDARPWFIDEMSMAQALSLAGSFQKGLKARWTHPNMSSDGLGNYLGRWRNFRLSESGDTLLADLHLARTAFRGGDESRGQWVLDMADDDPEAFGVSLAPRSLDLAAMEREETEDGKQPMRFLSLTAADVVDEPAATRGGLFGGQLSVATAPAAATQFLDVMFEDADADVIRERAAAFVETYLSTRFGGAVNHDKEPEMAQEETQAPDAVAELTATVADLKTQLAELKNEKGEAANLAVDIAADRKRSADLLDLAANAGLDGADKLAKEWIAKGLSVTEAKAVIGDLAIKQNTLTSDAGEPADDPDAAFKAEYKANLAAYKAAGVTEEDYVDIQKSLAATGGV
jgi:polyhydroxyalkanoate synthesis regulator phasin